MEFDVSMFGTAAGLVIFPFLVGMIFRMIFSGIKAATQ